MTYPAGKRSSPPSTSPVRPMQRCSRCQKRKSKRHCLALGQSICSLCCGKIRDKEVHCPAGCPYLSKHRSYQEKRIVEKRHPSPEMPDSRKEDPLKEERMAWLAFHIEMPVLELAEKRTAFMDREVLLAMEYAREKMEKGGGRIFLPHEPLKPQNELGEAMIRAMDRCRFERRVILTGEPAAYSQDEKLKVLNRIIAGLKQLAGDNLEGNAYIRAVRERFAKMQNISQQQKLLKVT